MPVLPPDNPRCISSKSKRKCIFIYRTTCCKWRDWCMNRQVRNGHFSASRTFSHPSTSTIMETKNYHHDKFIRHIFEYAPVYHHLSSDMILTYCSTITESLTGNARQMGMCRPVCIHDERKCTFISPYIYIYPTISTTTTTKPITSTSII